MSEILTAQFIIPTAISLGALFLSNRANKISKEAAIKSHEAQERFEVYQFYPMLSVKATSEENKIRLTVRNDSPNNSSSEITIRFVLRISAEGTYSIDKEDKFEISAIQPQKSASFFPEQINKHVEHGISFLAKTDPEKSHFVLRVVAEYSSAHPNSEKLSRVNTTYYKYINGELKQVEGCEDL